MTISQRPLDGIYILASQNEVLDEIYSFQVSFWLGYFKSMFKTCKYVTSPHAQLIGNSANCQNLSVLCGRRVSLTVNCDCFRWLLATDSNFHNKRRFTLMLPTGVNIGFFTSWSRTHCAIRVRTKDTIVKCYVPLFVRRAVTNTGNSSKFLPQCHVAMRSDTAGGCLSVSWELGTYAPAWIIEIRFHCSY